MCFSFVVHLKIWGIYEAVYVSMPLLWKFQQLNDSKHWVKCQKHFFLLSLLNPITDRPSQPIDLNPIENLWKIVDNKIKD